jgi:hypothetical protein
MGAALIGKIKVNSNIQFLHILLTQSLKSVCPCPASCENLITFQVNLLIEANFLWTGFASTLLIEEVTYCHVWGVYVTNTTGFGIRWLDLLALLLQLKPNITPHNQWLRLAPFLAGLWLWLVTSSPSVVRWLTVHSWTLDFRIFLRLNCSSLHGYLYILLLTMESVFCLSRKNAYRIIG